MALSVWSGLAHVTASLPGPGRIELYAVRPAGEHAAHIVVEAYDADGLVAGGEVVVWELNQALAALMSDSTQARRLALRDDGRGHGGYLDVVKGDGVDVVATGKEPGRQVMFRTTTAALTRDLNAVLRAYLDLTRTAPPAGTLAPAAPLSVVLADVVLPDVLSLPAPAPR